MPNWLAEPPRDWLPAAALDLEDQGEQKAAGDSADLQALHGRINKVQLGVPRTIDMLETWPSTERLTAEIAAIRERCDLYSVRVACSFIPDRGCRFVHARLAITLCEEGATGPKDGPITLDLFPREVTVKRTFSRSYGLKGGLKLSFLELSADAVQKEEGLEYDPAVIGAGLLTDSPSWTFDASGSAGLIGIRELFLLIQKSKGSNLMAQFAVGAEVRTAWGLRRYSKKTLLKTAHILQT